MMNQRVVVTGLGCVSPLGNDADTTWQNLLNNQSGAGLITYYDTSDYDCKIAAEVKDFDGSELFGPREARRMDRGTQYTLAAAQEAVQDASLVINEANRDRIGAVVGTGIGGINILYDQFLNFMERGPSRVSPFLVPMMLPDTPGSTLAINLDIRGTNFAVVTACATGTNAIGEASQIIQRGQADVMLAGGCEAAIVPLAMASLSKMGAMTTYSGDPTRASRPFNLDRTGFLMGEGAAVLVLESLQHAQNREAQILAELVGYGSTNDAFHISAPAENGAGAAQCMKQALESAGITTENIDYINAHGTGTPLNDKSETAAIKTVFGDTAYQIPVSSTKSMTGHLLGAAGAIEALFSIRAIQESIIPATINYEVPDPECDLDYVPNQPRPKDLKYVMSNSFGFGGHNASIILRKFEGK
ncbi:MAG: beta-ketoacyl-ACP synthase II [Chloroflexota bacterium]|nr:MAG: beta-ketoacyl-ACP synthase II [Chloroflexota bacterium]